MAVYGTFRFTLKLSVLLIVVIVHNDVALNMMAATQFSVRPLWDVVSNDTHPCAIVEMGSSEGTLSVRGSLFTTCSLQVNSSLNFHTLIEIPEMTDDSTFFLYIKRRGDLAVCLNRYVMLAGQDSSCRAVFVHGDLQLDLQGNASLSIREIPESESPEPACLDSSQQIPISQDVREIAQCRKITGYTDQVTCSPYHCDMDLPEHCNTTLRNRDVVLACLDVDGFKVRIISIFYPDVLLVLVLHNKNIQEIDVSAFRGLHYLLNLYIVANPLAVLPVGVFSGLERLVVLFLFENQLSVLDADIFVGLSNLEVLAMHKNKLVMLDVSLFRGLYSLMRLDLDQNLLSTLPGGVFCDLRNLKYIFLNDNQLVSLNTTIFHGVDNLVEIYLYNNKLQYLSDGLFRGLEKLIYVQLNYNQLINLGAHLFQGVPNNRFVFLAFNQLIAIPSGLFQGMESLHTIYLNHNQLVSLNATMFQGLRNLISLKLYRNDIRELPTELFSGLTSLEVLFLNDNQLNTLRGGLFHDLGRLIVLYLHSNNLDSLPDSVFFGLHSLVGLDLSLNQIVTLNAGIFEELYQLDHLIMHSNMLNVLPVGLFLGLHGLTQLYFADNQVATLEVGLFRDLGNLSSLDITNNRLNTLTEGAFEGLSNLKHLILNGNQLVSLDAQVFRGLDSLGELQLSYNQLITVDPDVFQGLNSLTYVVLYNNSLSSLPVGMFLGLGQLERLYLDKNQLVTVADGIFNGLSSLRILFLQHNQLVQLPANLLHDLLSLEVLYLYYNQLTSLEQNFFRGLTNLRYLLLAYNQLEWMDADIFSDAANVERIELSNNKLSEIPNIQNLTRLSYFNLQENPLIKINSDNIAGITNLTMLVGQHEICECYASDQIKCDAANDRSPYLTCGRLLSDRVLMAMMWVIGVNAFGGNILVLGWRKKNFQKNKVQDLLLSNLALSDLLMGVYMLFLASADIYFGLDFPMQSENWRLSISCRTIGAISIISSEASVFLVMLISIDRFVSIRFPYSTKKLGRSSAIVTIIIIWIVSLMLGIVPSALAGRVSSQFYDNSHVCIGLPLALTGIYHTKKVTSYEFVDIADFYLPIESFTTDYLGLENNTYFSTAVFLGLNSICYLVILGCYIEIVRAVQKSSKQSGRTRDMKEQIRLTTKVTAIVATDFCCWFPIIVLGFLVQARVYTLPPSVFAWLVTFVLPINSAINPYMYSLADIITNYRKKRVERRAVKEKEIALQQGNKLQSSQLPLSSPETGTDMLSVTS